MHKSVFKKNQLIIITIIVSVSFHLVILYLMQQGASSKPLKDLNKTPKVKPLQAQLIFELPTQPITPPEPVPLPEPTIESKPKPELIEQPSTTSASKKVAITKPQPPAIIKPQVEVQKPLDVAEPVIQKVATQPKINSQFTGTAGKHIQQYNAEQDAQMVSEASRYFQQQKNSPLIHAPKRNQFVTEEEKLMNQTKIRANCNGTAKATVAILLGFMGGNVSCTRPPSINGFINKRINKESSLPAKYNRPLDKLPKSVVIKE